MLYESARSVSAVFLGANGDGGQAVHIEAAAPGFRELFKHYKSEVQTMVSNDGKARESAFNPMLPGEAYESQISPYSHIFIQLKEDSKWYVWKETFDARGRQVKGDSGNVLQTVRRSVSINMLATNVNTFDMALMEASKYVVTCDVYLNSP